MLLRYYRTAFYDNNQLAIKDYKLIGKIFNNCIEGFASPLNNYFLAYYLLDKAQVFINQKENDSAENYINHIFMV